MPGVVTPRCGGADRARPAPDDAVDAPPARLAPIDGWSWVPLDADDDLVEVVAEWMLGDDERASAGRPVQGRRRLVVLNASEIAGHDVRSDSVVVDVRDRTTGVVTPYGCDAVVFATGYRPVDVADLLGTAGERLVRDAEGRPVVGRDHRLAVDGHATAGLFVQGGTEHSHGLGATLLSNIAVRAGEVLDAVLASRLLHPVGAPAGRSSQPLANPERSTMAGTSSRPPG